MTDKDNGGPAFPAPEAARWHFADPSAYLGMTLRDYLAANTPPIEELGVIAAESITGLKLPVRDNYKDESDFWVDSIGFWALANAKYRYMQADAMLEARES